MKKISFGFIESVSICIGITVLFCLLMFNYMVTPVSYEEKWRDVEIPEGSTFTDSINILKEKGLIKSRLGMLLMGRISRSDRDIKAGYYNFSESMTPLQIFNNLVDGRTIQFTITIPEGSELMKIRKQFLKTDLMDDESWQLVYDEEFIRSLELEAPSLEGYLYPDTYKFSKGIKPETIFKIMVQRLKENFDEPLRKRSEEMGMSENKVLTLASIIEKEAIYDTERPIISAVYHNRLKKNMRLQADPTVLYGVKNRWKRIRYKDLKRETPYNTYRFKGLPPGPIASPGIKSIRAALYPSDVDYLYFVSKNNGLHYFSKSNAEHSRAVVQYQLNGVKKIKKNKKSLN
jgi:UPF0755 protein